MPRKINRPVLETQYGDRRDQPVRIRKRNRTGPYWESEGFIVPIEDMGKYNPVRGKGPCFVQATEEWRRRGLQRC
jgi:hypothetical protein